MTIKRLLSLSLMASSISTALAAEPPAVTAVLDSAYGRLNPKTNCRLFQWEGQDYCVHLDSLNSLKVGDKTQLYLLTTGNVYDRQTQEEGGAHAASGIVGGFVLDTSTQPPAVILATPVAGQYGGFGVAPSDWKFTQIGTTTWGWTNTSGYTAQGYTNGFFHLLAPKDKRLQELASIPQFMSDEGACERACTELSATLSFQAQPNSPLYPISAQVSGTLEGKPFSTAPKTLHFDLSQGTYSLPKNWPITPY